jgi:lipoprotein-anchoring transpeptidase ErfK/SrfK
MRRAVAGGRVWAIAALLTVVLAGCGRSSDQLPLFRADVAPKEQPPAPPPTTPVVAAEVVSRKPAEWPVVERNIQLPGPPFNVAEVKVPKIGVYDSPTAPDPRISLGSRTEHGFPRVFLVAGQDGDRWKVLLPVRPNGSVGWVRAADVDIQQINYWVRVDTPTHTMTVGNADQLVTKESVAVGTGGTPTPTGVFYLMELIRAIGQPYYGPYAYATSAHSDVLDSFMGGDGGIGLHGTNAPGSIGRAASHGCIRVSNATITMLARTLPLGTPLIVT